MILSSHLILSDVLFSVFRLSVLPMKDYSILHGNVLAFFFSLQIFREIRDPETVVREALLPMRDHSRQKSPLF